MKDLKNKKVSLIDRLFGFPGRNKRTRKRPHRQWWWTAAAINVAETTDCIILDDEGEVEYSLWKPGGFGLSMADTEKLALWNNKHPGG